MSTWKSNSTRCYSTRNWLHQILQVCLGRSTWNKLPTRSGVFCGNRSMWLAWVSLFDLSWENFNKIFLSFPYFAVAQIASWAVDLQLQLHAIEHQQPQEQPDDSNQLHWKKLAFDAVTYLDIKLEKLSVIQKFKVETSIKIFRFFIKSKITCLFFFDGSFARLWYNM